MEKNTTVILSVLAGIGIGAGIYFYIDSQKDKRKDLGGQARGEKTEETPKETPVNENFPLEVGSEGEEVKILQQYLNRSSSCSKKTPPPNPNARMRGFLPLVEDGIFGDHTRWVLETCYKTESIDQETFEKMKKGLEKMTVNG